MVNKAMEKAFEAQARIQAIINEAENGRISWEDSIEQMKAEINSISIEEEEESEREWREQYMEENKFNAEEPEDDLRELELGDFVKVLHNQQIKWGEVVEKDEFKISVEFNDEENLGEYYLWEIINMEKNTLQS